MKLLANENIPLASIRLLSKEGFDITSIGADNPSIQDTEVIQLAINEERTIITFDKDYGALIFKHGYKPKAGVIILRLFEFEPEEPGRILLGIFNNAQLDFFNKLTIVDSSNIRQRKY